MAHAKRYLFEAPEKLFADYNHALGHPARRKVIELLRQERHLVFEQIAREIPLAKSTIQSHLRFLERVNLIKVGPNEFWEAGYLLNRPAYEEARTLMLEFWQLE